MNKLYHCDDEPKTSTTTTTMTTTTTTAEMPTTIEEIVIEETMTTEGEIPNGGVRAGYELGITLIHFLIIPIPNLRTHSF